MAKEAKANAPSATNVKEAVRKIEGYGSELLSERGTYMNRCQKIRAKINDVYDVAADQGIAKKGLKALIKKRGYVRKAADVVADFERDDRSFFEMLEEKLGDFGLTPLGKAALSQARKVEAAAPPAPGVDGKTLDELASTQH